MVDKPLGELLIEHGLIRQEQLSEALDVQKKFPDLTVGQLLCRLGYVRDADLSLVLDQKNKRRKLEEIFLLEGILDADKISQGKDLSRKNDISLEAALLKLRHIDEEQLARAVAIQYDLPYVEINSLTLDPSLGRYISSVYAQKHLLVPISMIGSTLTLAMAKPLRYQDIRQLEDSIRLKIIWVIASEASVLRAIKTLYRVDVSVDSNAFDEVNLDLVPDSISELLNKTSAAEEPDVEEEVRKVTEKDSVIVKLVNKIIYDAYTKKASDIHIEPYPGKRDIVVRIRVDGQCIVYQKIPYKYKFAIPSRIKIMAELDIAERRRPQDGKIDFKKFGPLDIELRVATMPTVGHLEDVVIRLLGSGEPISFSQLGLTQRNQSAFERAISSPYGLVLVVGPTGSGKTTTLHSGLALINSAHRKIWTAEDPVEITQPGLRQVQVNPKIGFTFAAALRSFLRLDPDIIMVGEMRDEETASIAVEASLTGHLVFSTLHTNTAPETITRLLEMGLDPYSFADSLLCVLGQRLARKLCTNCRQAYKPSAEELDEIMDEFGGIQIFNETGGKLDELNMFRAVGCPACEHSGYHGRLGIHEVLEASSHIKGLIKKRADTDEIRAQAIVDGMRTLKQDGILKVLHGLTDMHEVRRVCIK